MCTMASSSDFTLYPYSETWNQEQTYLPTSTYSEQGYLAAPSFDSFQEHQSFARRSQQFELVGNHLKAPESSANYSPASSASHSFDHNNHHHISSVSDSGASVPSTISSAMGSPLMQPQSSDWRQQTFPSIVQHDGFYPGNNFDSETVPVLDKGCVGERPSLNDCLSILADISTKTPPSSSHIHRHTSELSSTNCK